MNQISLWTPDGHRVYAGTRWRHSFWDPAIPDAVVGEILFDLQFVRWSERGGDPRGGMPVRYMRQSLGWTRIDNVQKT